MKTKESITIKINYDELYEIIKEQITFARDFSWTGWRIPIYVEENGRVYAGGWLSQGSFQPDAIEIYAIRAWYTSDMTEEDEPDEYLINDIINLVVDNAMRDFKEGVLYQFNELNENYQLEILDES